MEILYTDSLYDKEGHDRGIFVGLSGEDVIIRYADDHAPVLVDCWTTQNILRKAVKYLSKVNEISNG